MSFRDTWAQIEAIGRTDSGGYVRYALTEPELILRDWFRNQADARDMPVTDDGMSIAASASAMIDTASLSAAPGTRLKLIVSAGNWSWWLTASGAVV